MELTILICIHVNSADEVFTLSRTSLIKKQLYQLFSGIKHVMIDKLLNLSGQRNLMELVSIRYLICLFGYPIVEP